MRAIGAWVWVWAAGCGAPDEPAAPPDPEPAASPTSVSTSTPTPPTTPTTPAPIDTDGDGLDDAEEDALGTDPLLPDTDGDELSDGEEVALGTDPLLPDTDGDELPDGEEVALGTDPTLPDSDGDGFLDGDEVQSRGDPLDPGVGVYQGGWPYNPDKDVLPTGSWSQPADIGVLLPREALPDQFGNAVDLYDFAGHGAPVVLMLTAPWVGPGQQMSTWIAGLSPDFYGLYDERIPELVASGEVLWVTVLVEDASFGPPTQADAADYADLLRGGVSTPILADNPRDFPFWTNLQFYPDLVLLEEDLSVAVLSDGSYTPILDELLARFP